MKVFNFTNGKKGNLLAEIPRPNWFGGWFVKKMDKTFKVELVNKIKGWQWVNSCGKETHNNEGKITPNQFNVEAICFCNGEFIIGQDDNGQDIKQWDWNVLGTCDWNRAACNNGILKITQVV